jgi:hypothetical protein
VSGEGLRGNLDPVSARLLPHRLEEGDARRQDRGLGVHREVELLGRPLEDHLRQRDAERLVSALKGGRGGG